MNDQPRRLYIFTGKGGVGKTTLSKAFVRNLVEHDHEAIYLAFKNQSLGETHQGNSETMVDGIKEVHLDLEDSAEAILIKSLIQKS